MQENNIPSTIRSRAQEDVAGLGVRVVGSFFESPTRHGLPLEVVGAAKMIEFLLP